MFGYTANSIKVVLTKACTVNYERARDYGNCIFSTSKIGNCFFETASRAHRKLTTANLLATKVNP